jgi:hypothetical protein
LNALNPDTEIRKKELKFSEKQPIRELTNGAIKPTNKRDKL